VRKHGSTAAKIWNLACRQGLGGRGWRADGHRVELLLPAVQMIDIDEAPVRHLAMPNANSNLWGLPAPRSWVEEATPFASVEIGGHGADSTRMTLESWLAARRLPAGTA
jgi:hypothetical protein